MWKIRYSKELKQRNPEFNILLILSENENGCRYSDFLNEKMQISESSVNKYLKSLQDEVFVRKVKFFLEEGEDEYIEVYKITEYGLERLEKLKSD